MLTPGKTKNNLILQLWHKKVLKVISTVFKVWIRKLILFSLCFPVGNYRWRLRECTYNKVWTSRKFTWERSFNVINTHIAILICNCIYYFTLCGQIKFFMRHVWIEKFEKFSVYICVYTSIPALFCKVIDDPCFLQVP